MKITTPTLLLIIFAIPSLCNAASFDCSKAQSRIEKMICSDTFASRLDDSLSAVYRHALDSADKPNTLKSDQKQWLKTTRENCKTEAELTQVYKDRIAALRKVPKYSWKTFRDTTLGIEFEYPGIYTIKCDYPKFSIYILGNDMPDSDYLMHFEVWNGSFEDVNSQNDLFISKDGKWYAAFGRFENPPADSVYGKGWSGLETIITCGISNKETGFHAAGGECFWALISNGSRSVIADTQGIVGTDELTMKSFRSIKLLATID